MRSSHDPRVLVRKDDHSHVKRKPPVTRIDEAETRQPDTAAAKIVRYPAPSRSREPGLLKGKVTIRQGFNDPSEGFDAFE